ncbi:MAG: phospho-sugar mutase [Clostridiales Family XIII bacterium]|jgi:phosphoglucomutase|nr:phospho-sugar mutase [Clostridiales Family XIII bacterium]
MAESIKKLEEWLVMAGLPDELRAELAELKERSARGDADAAAEIDDRFYRDLEFGTAGLRGILGAGTNRMNAIIIRRATQGYAEHIIMKHSGGAVGADESQCSAPRVAIAYDNRRCSDEFAFETACVFVANGIETHLFPSLSSTPMLSWAVRELGCDGGVVVTASHNPKQYNGYKIYDSRGCQCLEADANDVAERIAAVPLSGGAKTVADRYAGSLAERIAAAEKAEALFHVIPESFESDFVDRVREKTALREGAAHSLSVVYTPLNGAGSVPVRKALADIGVGRVETVPEQKAPDPEFSTCPEPNPEKEAALRLGLELCRRRAAEGAAPDLLIGTDPDCDRVGCAVYDGSDYVQLTGNQVGVLMFDYIAEARAGLGTMPKDPIMITTIVSTPLTLAIADGLGVSYEKTLTGFKYIGDRVSRLEAEGGDSRFIFGFEESCGYCAHPLVRDKDGVGTSLLLCEMAGYYKENGKTLLGRLDEIYEKYGCYIDAVDELVRPGKSGMEEIRSAMEKARAVKPEAGGAAGSADIIPAIVRVTDYLPGETLPSSNVIQYDMAGGGRIMLRPSGTEPKLKIYYSAKGSDKAAAKAALEGLRKAIARIGITG